MEIKQTPISVLQDYCARTGVQADYQLLSVEGRVHAPTFTYLALVGTLATATASGLSKKKARHSAALALLEKLSKLEHEACTKEFLVASLAFFNESGEQEDNPAEGIQSNGDNPVGKLQEVCMRMKWGPPNYETIEEEGLAHERRFTLKCEISKLQLVVIGEGRAKRAAKRTGAEKMLLLLEEQKHYDPISFSMAEKSPKYRDSHGADSAAKNCTSKEQIDDFVEKLANNEVIQDELKTEIQDIDNIENYAIILKKLADSMNCKVKIVAYPASDIANILNVAHLMKKGAEVPMISGCGMDVLPEKAEEKACKNLITLLGKIAC